MLSPVVRRTGQAGITGSGLARHRGATVESARLLASPDDRHRWAPALEPPPPPVPPWLNRSSGVAGRNGTASHTIGFGFTPASGSLVVVIVHGAVTHANSGGWTERLQPVTSGELSVFTKTVGAGESSITVTHNGSDYPVTWGVYEFAAGSTWVTGQGKSASAQPSAQTPPPLTGMTTTEKLVVAAIGRALTAAGTTASGFTWGAELAVDIDVHAPSNGVTDGTALSTAYATTTADSFTPTVVTHTLTGGGGADDFQTVTFVLELATGSSGVSALVDPAAESGAAQAVAGQAGAIASVAPATETDTAIAVIGGAGVAAAVTPAGETGAAVAVTGQAGSGAAVDPATETGTALPVSGVTGASSTVAAAVDSGSAQVVSGVTGIIAGVPPASEAGTAQPVTPAVGVTGTAPPASETGTAQLVTALVGVAATVDPASEVDEAVGVTTPATATVDPADETQTAQPVTGLVGVLAPVPSAAGETSSAVPVSAAVDVTSAVSAAVSSETATAVTGVTGAVQVIAAAAGSDVASSVVPVAGVAAAIEPATETGSGVAVAGPQAPVITVAVTVTAPSLLVTLRAPEVTATLTAPSLLVTL